MENLKILKELTGILENKGYNPVYGTVYQQMKKWTDWYRGEVNDFHKFRRKVAGGTSVDITKPSLNVFKMICETYSSLLWNEKSSLHVDESKQSILDAVIEDNNLYNELGVFLEMVAMNGTGVAIEYIADSKTKVSFSYGDTMLITDYHNTTPKGIVIIQRFQKGKKYYTHLTIHTYRDGMYRVEHEMYASEKEFKLGERVGLEALFSEEEINAMKHEEIIDDNVVVKYYNEYETEVPHFQVFKYNIVNNFDFSPMGISVGANSISLFESIDEKFYSSVEDSINSRKIVFMGDEGLVSDASRSIDAAGNPIVSYINYVDRDKTLYMTFNANDEEDKMKFYEPTYTPEAHTEAIQFDLNLASIKSGLGTNYFSFKDGGVYVNEANVFASNSDMWRNRQANANLLKVFLVNMMKAIMYLEDSDSEEYVVKLDDSMIIDDDQILKDMKEDSDSGYIAKWRYVMTKYGITEEEAKEWVKEAEEEEDNRTLGFIETKEEVDGEES